MSVFSRLDPYSILLRFFPILPQVSGRSSPLTGDGPADDAFLLSVRDLPSLLSQEPLLHAFTVPYVDNTESGGFFSRISRSRFPFSS